jgi:signal peptidase I
VALTGDPTTDTGPPPARLPAASAGRPAPHRSPARRIATIVLVTAFTLALIRALLVQSFVVPTGSMEPTVHPGDRVLVSRLSYQFGDIHRGDVIVFDGDGVFDDALPPAGSPLVSAGRAVASSLGLPIGSSDYVKRVIGLPGDSVVCCDPSGRITVNDTALNETYVKPGDQPSTVEFKVLVPPGRLWVMGDHRSDSADSRAHLGDPGGGTVPVNRVVGRVAAIYWPFSRIGGITAAQKDVAGAAGREDSPTGKDQR